MVRFVPVAASLGLLALAPPVFAADYGLYPELRPAYPDEWHASDDNPLRFEAGLRYWYSWGGQQVDFDGADLNVRDNAHIGEVHLRIDDDSTQTFLRAYGGMSVASSGTMQLDQVFMTPIDRDLGAAGRVGYVVSDFGWMPFGNTQDGFSLGAIAGYQYWNDSPDIGRGNFAAVDSQDDIVWNGGPTYGLPYDSKVDNLDIHALRLGLAGQVDVGDMFDVRAEAVAIPYSWVTGTFGPHEVPDLAFPGGVQYKASETSLSGHGYGAAGELAIGFHPTENLTIRVGGRGWYLNGTLDATYTAANITNPVDTDPSSPGYEQGPALALQDYIFTSNAASLFRYGAFVELTGRF